MPITRNQTAKPVRPIKQTAGLLSKIGDDVEQFVPGLNTVTKLAKGELPPLSSALPAPLGPLLPGAPGPSKIPGTVAKAAEKKAEEVTSKIPLVKTAVSTATFLASLSELKTWIRIAKVLAGGVLILMGLYMLTKAISPAAAGVIVAPAKAGRRLAKSQLPAGAALGTLL